GHIVAFDIKSPSIPYSDRELYVGGYSAVQEPKLQYDLRNQLTDMLHIASYLCRWEFDQACEFCKGARQTVNATRKVRACLRKAFDNVQEGVGHIFLLVYALRRKCLHARLRYCGWITLPKTHEEGSEAGTRGVSGIRYEYCLVFSHFIPDHALIDI
ncbi:Hypothetical Protein FCC1311_016682, partial [Hondaea fermentalgiana]